MTEITVRTEQKRVLVDITDRVSTAIRDSGGEEGVYMVYVPHTTAGVAINEGADPSVARDIRMVFDRLAPDDLPYEHAEGNSPAHVMSCIAGSSVLVGWSDGAVELGTWQAIFFCEFDGPRTRRAWVRRL